MNQLILKNLWARRSRNLWLLAEIVLVCIVSWKIADPLVVLTHDRRAFVPIICLFLNWRLCRRNPGSFVPKKTTACPAGKTWAAFFNR